MSGANLSDVLAKVRDELEECDRRRIREGKPALFELHEFECELRVVVVENESVQGGFDVKVMSLGGSGSHQTETAQTIRVSYRVAGPDSKRKPVGSRFHSTSDDGPHQGFEVLE